MGDQTTTRTHVRRAQCSFGGEIAGERDRTALISQSASCATFPQSGTNHMPPKRAVNPDNRRATHDSSKMSSMNLSENLDRENSAHHRRRPSVRERLSKFERHRSGALQFRVMRGGIA